MELDEFVEHNQPENPQGPTVAKIADWATEASAEDFRIVAEFDSLTPSDV